MIIRVILTDSGIRWQVEAGTLRIDPFNEDLLQPASLDVTLGNRFVVFDRHEREYVDPRNPELNRGRVVEVGGAQPFILHPGGFALGYTTERISLPVNLAAQLAGKSSLGRCGLQLHATAGWIDPGFDGQLTLELSNVNSQPIRLWPGDPIGQVCFIKCDGDCWRPYGHPDRQSRYQGQEGPTPARRGPAPQPVPVVARPA
jgi:dCTP deaminase